MLLINLLALKWPVVRELHKGLYTVDQAAKDFRRSSGNLSAVTVRRDSHIKIRPQAIQRLSRNLKLERNVLSQTVRLKLQFYRRTIWVASVQHGLCFCDVSLPQFGLAVWATLAKFQGNADQSDMRDLWPTHAHLQEHLIFCDSQEECGAKLSPCCTSFAISADQDS